MARFLVVPQWQGSPSARAMSFIDGAEAIAGDLPRAARTVLEVPLEAGDALDTGVARTSALRRTRTRIAEELAGQGDDERVIVVGGDCGVAVPAVGHVAGDDLAVVWFDAHADLHDPASSPSGAFAGMALRAVLGEGEPSLSLGARGIPPERVVLVGARAFEDDEADYLARRGIRHVPSAEFDPDALAEAVAATGAARVHVHVDLDVLDPAAIAGVTDAQPFGLQPAELIAGIGAVRGASSLVGASVAGFAPARPDAAVDDMSTILRIIGALAR